VPRGIELQLLQVFQWGDTKLPDLLNLKLPRNIYMFISSEIRHKWCFLKICPFATFQICKFESSENIMSFLGSGIRFLPLGRTSKKKKNTLPSKNGREQSLISCISIQLLSFMAPWPRLQMTHSLPRVPNDVRHPNIFQVVTVINSDGEVYYSDTGYFLTPWSWPLPEK
jgi:hypothetical protein